MGGSEWWDSALIKLPSINSIQYPVLGGSCMTKRNGEQMKYKENSSKNKSNYFLHLKVPLEFPKMRIWKYIGKVFAIHINGMEKWHHSTLQYSIQQLPQWTSRVWDTWGTWNQHWVLRYDPYLRQRDFTVTLWSMVVECSSESSMYFLMTSRLYPTLRQPWLSSIFKPQSECGLSQNNW